uniref:Uncharacterized protein n=1 Tax=Rhodnius prolixus TaxID=13249 RepID=T1I815_RHOPR
MVTSGSPRPRIKTFLNKENYVREHTYESMTNRIPLVLDFELPSTNQNGEHNGKVSASASSPCNNNSSSSRAPDTSEQRPSNGQNGSLERRHFLRDQSDRTEGERPTSMADITASTKYAFLGYSRFFVFVFVPLFIFKIFPDVQKKKKWKKLLMESKLNRKSPRTQLSFN